MNTARRLQLLSARIDAVLFDMDDEEPQRGVGERMGGVAGAIGGAAAGAMLPTIAKHVAVADARRMLHPMVTVPTRAQSFIQDAKAFVPSSLKSVNHRVNAVLGRGGAKVRIAAGAIAGLGGYAAGKFVGRISDKLGYADDDK